MKRKVKVLFLTLVFMLMTILPVYAEGSNIYLDNRDNILNLDQERLIVEEAETASNEADLGIYTCICNDYKNTTGKQDIKDAAANMYIEKDLGKGEDKSGILLLVSIKERDYCLYAKGYGNTAFTDYGKEYLAESFKPDFGNDNWLGGILNYIDTSKNMVLEARNGNPIDVTSEKSKNNEKNVYYGVIACIAIGFIIAAITKGVLLRQLKSVEEKQGASEFISGAGTELLNSRDVYVHTTTTRVYDPKEDDSGGTTIDEHGGSSSSGKF